MTQLSRFGLKLPLPIPRFCLFGSAIILLAGLAMSLGAAPGVSLWLRVIVGLVVFVLPGSYLFVLIPARESWDLIDAIGYGFCYSIALITLLGLITRTLALSIDAVEAIWYLLALGGFAAAWFKSGESSDFGLQLHVPVLALVLIILVQVALYTHSSIFAAPASNDQNRHHVAVNGFLRDDPLSWSEPYYESGNGIADRMYLTYWVLAQALVVEISGVPILLARYLINPFVMIMSSMAMYIFARNLGHCRSSSLIYVCFGLLAYSLVALFGAQAGSQFFARPLLDKVAAAFALAPIAVSSAYLCVTSGERRAYFAFSLAFLAAIFVHAIPGGFAACVIGIFLLICLIKRRKTKRAARLLLLALLLSAPVILVRFNTAETTIYYFEELPQDTGQTIMVVESSNPLDNGNSFYAIHPVLAGVLTYVLILLVAVSVLLRRLDSRSELMLAYAIVIGIGLLPLTAWIFGRLVSFYHIVRVLWIMPYGYMLGFVLETGARMAQRYLPQTEHPLGWLKSDRARLPLLALAPLITAYALQLNPAVDFTRDLANVTDGDRELLEIAKYIDAQHDDRVWIAASERYRNRVISMHWKVISLSRFSANRMSYYSNLPVEDMRVQREANFRLYEADVPVEEKLEIVDRYGVDYLLFSKGYAWMVDALYQTDKERFELVYSGEELRLVRVH